MFIRKGIKNLYNTIKELCDCYWAKGVCLPVRIKAQSTVNRSFQSRKQRFTSCENGTKLKVTGKLAIKDLAPGWLPGNGLYTSKRKKKLLIMVVK